MLCSNYVLDDLSLAATPASSTGSSASTASVEKELHDLLRFLNRN